MQESGDIAGGGRSRSISLSSSTPSLSSAAGGTAPSSGRALSSQFAVWTALGGAAAAVSPPQQQQMGGDGPAALTATPAAASPAAALLGASGVGAGAPRRNAGPMKPVCVGELTAHADAVNALLAVSPFALAAAGSDGLVSLWKVRRVLSIPSNKSVDAHPSIPGLVFGLAPAGRPRRVPAPERGGAGAASALDDARRP